MRRSKFLALTAALGSRIPGESAVLREELMDRELDFAEYLAGIFGDASAVTASTAGAFFFGKAVVIHRHQQVGVPLQTDDGELAKGDQKAACITALHQILSEGIADGKRNFGDPTVTGAAVVNVYKLQV